jgi:hypothetical protein
MTPSWADPKLARMSALVVSGDAPPVRVFGLPPVWGTPNPSPFVIKLLTWLRMAGIAYEQVVLKRPPQSPTGKIPYVVLPDGRLLSDSSAIVETLAVERGVDLDAHLDARGRAEAHVIRRTIEEHLYFVGLYERFATPEGFARTGVDYFRHAPWPVPRRGSCGATRRRTCAVRAWVVCRASRSPRAGRPTSARSRRCSASARS